MLTRRSFALGTFGVATARVVLAQGEVPRNADGHELIGHPAPSLELAHWLNSRPLALPDLRGKVVLIRWWTNDCDLCAATAPALRKLQSEYGNRGLQVIGIYHTKPKGVWDMAGFQKAVSEKRFAFPVAFDGDWSNLKRWWLNGHRAFTSVSFLLDRNGIIRYIQPGGEYHEGEHGGFPTHESCHRDLQAIESEISHLLQSIAT